MGETHGIELSAYQPTAYYVLSSNNYPISLSYQQVSSYHQNTDGAFLCFSQMYHVLFLPNLTAFPIGRNLTSLPHPVLLHNFRKGTVSTHLSQDTCPFYGYKKKAFWLQKGNVDACRRLYGLAQN